MPLVDQRRGPPLTRLETDADVFNLAGKEGDDVEEVDRAHWGDIAESEDEEEEEEDAEEEEEEDGDDAMGVGAGGAETPMYADGGISSVSGLETPDTMMDLRKRAGADTPETTGISAAPAELYKVVPQRETNVGAGALFGGDRKYVLPGAKAGGAGVGADGAEVPRDVQVSLNPDEVDEQLADEEALRER